MTKRLLVKNGRKPPEWASRLQIDECDRHLLAEYRLEYKRGRRDYWKVLALRRGVKGSERRYVMLARLILSAPDHMQVDHINGDTLDNRRANLRLCTASENVCNRRAPMPLGYRGIAEVGNGFRAAIKKNRKFQALGTFATAADAARAYDRAAKILHGEFARLNFPEQRAGSHGSAQAGGGGPFSAPPATHSR